MLYRKGINDVVVVGLLLFVSISSVMIFSNWFNDFKSGFETELESTNLGVNLKISRVDGTKLYMENYFKDDLLIKEVKIDSRDCYVQDFIIDKGTVIVDIGNCNSGFQDLESKEVTLVTDYGVHSEYQRVKNPVKNSVVFSYQTEVCDISAGYRRLFSLTSLENAHVNIGDLGAYRLCVRSFGGDLKFDKSNSNYKSIMYLIGTNNSAVWLNKSMVYKEPAKWDDIGFYIEGKTFDVKINSTEPEYGYICLGAVDRDDIYGSHFGDCSSSMSDKIWLSFE